MSIADAFLHDILRHPGDDAPRLIFADWLDEHNDPRGEFIRIQCALAQLSDEDPHRWPLEQREQELLREHEAKWLPKEIGNVLCVFRRGFVEEVTLFIHDFPTVAERLFEQIPLQHLCLCGGPLYAAEMERTRQGMGLDRIAQSPHLARLRGLSLDFPLGVEDWRSLRESPYLAKLTDLKIIASRRQDISIDWAGVLHRPALRRLTLCHNALSLDDLPVLANAASLTGLRELNLNDNRLTHRAASILAGSRLLSQLETLHLESNLLGDAGAVAMREWPALPRLARLYLGHNQFFPAGAQALAQAPALRELIALDLFGNISCDDGAADLASAEWTRLQSLNLRFNGVGDRGVRSLARSESLSQLTRLNLTANRITGDGARALAESPRLPRLARLDLLRNDIGSAQQKKLSERFDPFVYF